MAPPSDPAVAPEPPPAAPSARSARYQVLREHGRGGLGRVSRAHDRELCRDIAIKELIERGPITEVRFLREAMITARLEHPGIVPIYEAGRWPDGTPFYAMKLVAGRELRELIAERTSVDNRIDLLHHVIAVADAIAYAHGRNIIHRDLKPANVIVGDFGETIVIDWGLAKDLGEPDESTSDTGTTSGDDGLTSAGAVLGTPAYMAPEQRLGHRVDQRADVFAIGAMLWELCVLRRSPPAESQARHRMLRRAGIDRDLAAIIDKALEEDPERRYRDAGALAADLKAFKSGARITARDYSLFALLAHWTRLHRTLALSATTALVVALIGATLAVRNIAIERDRADAALAQAEMARTGALRANAATEDALAAQTLEHAALLVTTDPSAAIDVLGRYRGRDPFRKTILRTQAEGRGVARMRAAPHTRSILWLRGLADHSVVTQSGDGTIALTSERGAVSVLARDASAKNTRAYADKRKLLAYVCKLSYICVLDLSRPAPTISAPFDGSDPDGLAFSPSEQRLAAVNRDTVTVWDVSDLTRPRLVFRSRATGFAVFFLDEHTVVAGNIEKLAIVSARQPPVALDLPDATVEEPLPHRRALAIGTAHGTAALVTAATRRAGRPTKLCEGPVSALLAIPGDKLAYGCNDGAVGLWDLGTATVTPLVTVQGTAEFLVLTPDRRDLAIGGSSGALSILDLETKIVTSYLGHNIRLTAIAAPDASYPYFASGDTNGHLRVWPRRRPLARVALTAPLQLIDVGLLGDAGTAIATSPASSLHVASQGGVRAVGPHEVAACFLELAPDRKHFATYGWGGNIELWSSDELRRVNVIESRQPATVRLSFLGAEDLVWGGTDGRVLRWTSAAGLSTLAEFPQPVAMFAALPRGPSLAVALADGTLWTVTLDGTTRPLASQTEKAAVLAASPDGKWLAAGNDGGVVVVYDTARWHPTTALRTSGPIRQLAFSPASDLVAVGTTTGLVQLGRSAGGQAAGPDDPARWNAAAMTWTSFAASPRDLAFTPSGDLLIVTCGDGVVWFYSVLDDRWLYYPTGTASITVVTPAADGRSAATADSAGRLLVFDLDAVRETLRGPGT